MSKFWSEVAIESLVGVIVYIFLYFTILRKEGDGIINMIIFCVLIIFFFLFVNGGIQFFNFLDDTTN